MTFFIPARDMPVDAVKVTDPVTEATYMRPRKVKFNLDPTLQKHPKQATCRTPFCTKAGLPHSECQVRYPRDTIYAFPSFTPSTAYQPPRQTRPFVPPRPPDSSTDSPTETETESETESEIESSAEENGFRRWLESFPDSEIPRERPVGRRPPARTGGRYSPYHVFEDLPRREAPHTPQVPRWRYPQNAYTGTPWANDPDLPNRVPDRMEWDNVQGGKLQWTPHPWVAHPLPHPDVPAHVFWNYPIHPSTLHPWVGPGGWSPYYGVDPERMHMLTGGHPTPGMDPYWTPTRWVPPLYAPQYGVALSPWLAPSPRNPCVPHVLWDVSVEPPYTIRRLTSRGVITDFASTDFFKGPATYPAVRTLQVNLPNMRSSWGPVVINKDSPIQVGDVFKAVWDYLHKQLTPDDWEALKRTYGRQRTKRIEYAFERRCRTASGLYQYVRSQGLRRVDLLEGRTVYWGTYLTYNADWTWSLTIGFLPRTRPAR